MIWVIFVVLESGENVDFVGFYRSRCRSCYAIRKVILDKKFVDGIDMALFATLY